MELFHEQKKSQAHPWLRCWIYRNLSVKLLYEYTSFTSSIINCFSAILLRSWINVRWFNHFNNPSSAWYSFLMSSNVYIRLLPSSSCFCFREFRIHFFAAVNTFKCRSHRFLYCRFFPVNTYFAMAEKTFYLTQEKRRIRIWMKTNWTDK